MLRTKEARRKLTRREQKHLTDAGVHTMEQMRKQVAHARALCPDNPGSVCWTCWGIARKLDLVEEVATWCETYQARGWSGHREHRYSGGRFNPQNLPRFAEAKGAE